MLAHSQNSWKESPAKISAPIRYKHCMPVCIASSIIYGPYFNLLFVQVR